jgi:hypothetical protein
MKGHPIKLEWILMAYMISAMMLLLWAMRRYGQGPEHLDHLPVLVVIYIVPLWLIFLAMMYIVIHWGIYRAVKAHIQRRCQSRCQGDQQ